MTEQNKHNIVVVDDDVDYLTQMRLQLEAAGYQVTTLESVSEAQQWLDAHTADLAIVDLMMEHFDDGFSLCHQIKQRHPEMPVIMVTGVAAETGMRFDAATRDEKAWVKADALLNKPVRFEQLQRELGRLLKD